MAVYKVIQDIESEDKLLGPLTLKGFVYAAIAAACAFINFKLLFIGTPLKWLLIFAFFWPMLLFGVLASPLGREQPTEVWLLARIRFFFKPRQRIWDQEGLSQLVTITVPKKADLHLTKDLTQSEVQSRLKTLATTLDTRGWAIKNVDVNLNDELTDQADHTTDSDRLIKPSSLPQGQPIVDIKAADDILDEKSNPTARKFEAMMQQADRQRKHGILATLKGMVATDNKRQPAAEERDPLKIPEAKAALARMERDKQAWQSRRRAEAEEELQQKLADARARFSDKFVHEHQKPKARRRAVSLKQTIRQAKPPTVTAAAQADNMELAQSGSAFSVATLSSLANRQGKIQQTGPDEVTISLH